MSTSLAPGLVIAGRYRLDHLLGRGGMGQVWAVTHEVTLRTAALKFLNGPVHERPERRRRFLREARAASAVNHPNVVQIHDFFELEDGTPVMVMDLLDGETLGERLAREESLPLAEAADVLLPVVSAVGTAHAMGIVHRDLKPHNVFLARSVEDVLDVRVLDFGIAKLSTAETTADPALTETGMMLGTPCYMSPEQSFGEKDVDHRTDVWSIGVMLYETLSGVRPLDGDNAGQVLKRLVTEVITPIEVLVPDLPTDVAGLIGRMLTRDPAGRPEDLREVQSVLERHGTVTVPAFGPAVSERPPIVDSSPMSQRSSPRQTMPSRPPPDSGAAPPTQQSGPAGARDTDVEPLASRASAPPSSRPAMLAVAAVALAGAVYAVLHFSGGSAGSGGAAGAESAATPEPLVRAPERAAGREPESPEPAAAPSESPLTPPRAPAATANGEPLAAEVARPEPPPGHVPRAVRSAERRDPGAVAPAGKGTVAPPVASEGLIDEPPF
jgi:eukaryotic-like serine/threonine-protein kinase